MCVLSRGGAVKDCVLLREAVLLDDLSLAHSQVHVLMCCLSVCVCPLFYLFLISAVFYKSIYLFMYVFLSHSHQHDFTISGTTASVSALYLPSVNTARFLGMVEFACSQTWR